MRECGIEKLTFGLCPWFLAHPKTLGTSRAVSVSHAEEMTGVGGPAMASGGGRLKKMPCGYQVGTSSPRSGGRARDREHSPLADALVTHTQVLKPP